MIKKIISGGQTGADRAALDFAIEHAIPHGGWVPKGREAEDGPLADRYQVEEMPTAAYPERTEQNVIDSDGTLIISHGTLTGGSAFTEEMARKHNRPQLHLNMATIEVDEAARKVRSWIEMNRVEVLNVAGPRESNDATIYDTTLEVLHATFV